MATQAIENSTEGTLCRRVGYQATQRQKLERKRTFRIVLKKNHIFVNMILIDHEILKIEDRTAHNHSAVDTSEVVVADSKNRRDYTIMRYNDDKYNI